MRDDDEQTQLVRRTDAEVDDDKQDPDPHLGVSAAVSLMVNKMIGTGIFSVPSSIYTLTGSVGWSMIVWILGGFIAYSGLNVYLEFGLEIPRSGSEKNYLERVYRWPRHLALCIFTIISVVLTFSTDNSYVFGLYLMQALGIQEASTFAKNVLAISCITFAFVIHAIFPTFGKHLFTALGVFKIVALAIMVVSGLLVLGGLVDIGPLPNNWHNPFVNEGFGGGISNFAIALIRVFYSYRGWESCNNVMGEIIEPARTMKIAGPLAIGSITLLYTFCNIVYFSVIPKQQIIDAGVIIAASYFKVMFGDNAASRILPLIISLSNLGNVLVVTYACGRINRELARYYLLPFSSKIASLKPFGTPLIGLAIHWFMTVLLLLLAPSNQVYNFVVDLSTYPLTLLHFSVSAGLIYLQYNHVKENWGMKYDSYHSPLPLTLVYLLSNLFLIIVPWIPPNSWPAEKLPYWSVPAAGITMVCFVGPLYWWFWKSTRNASKLERILEQQHQRQIQPISYTNI